MYSHGKAKCGSMFLKPQPFEVRCVQRQEELHLMKTENAHVAGGQAQGITGMSHEWGAASLFLMTYKP